MTFAGIHGVWAWVVVVSNAVAGLWALGAHRLPALRHRALWIVTAAAQVAIGIQVLLGVLALQLEEKEIGEFHMFYGFVAFASVGIIYSYRQQLEAWTYLLYGFGGLFLMGLGLRAIFLA
ncbi:MAG: hypothetical protein R2710_05060 [Acidimicrobiales bacterium]